MFAGFDLALVLVKTTGWNVLAAVADGEDSVLTFAALACAAGGGGLDVDTHTLDLSFRHPLFWQLGRAFETEELEHVDAVGVTVATLDADFHDILLLR